MVVALEGFFGGGAAVAAGHSADQELIWLRKRDVERLLRVLVERPRQYIVLEAATAALRTSSGDMAAQASRLRELRRSTAEALRAVYVILDETAPEDRAAFTLRYLEGMELTEVAEACGCSLATVKRRVSRAQVALFDAAKQHPLLCAWLENEES